METARATNSKDQGIQIAESARQALDERHGEEIVLLDVRDHTSVMDYVVIVSGSSPPHLKALFGEVQNQLKRSGIAVYRRAGTPECGWMVLDYIDTVIHIFSPDARRYYALEELWARAPRLS
jgi:ribosome-associated protein